MAKEPIKPAAGTGSDSPAFGTAATGVALETGTKPAVAEAGTADQVAQSAEKPVVIGAAERATEPGGPGVGAARLASEAQGFASRPLTATAATDLGLRPRTALEREELTEAEREELAGLRRPPTEREELDFLRRMRAPAGVVVDAADVTGRRLARVAAPILRDGVKYAPGTDNDTVPVDFAAYTELVGIGAITDTRWDHLDPVGD